MVAYYVDRIKKGKITIDQVPLRWRENVEWEIEKNGAFNKRDFSE